jgi:glycosyltransferase involved in cell wall biosynthesis
MKIMFHHRIASFDGQAVHSGALIAALRAIGHEVVVVGPPVLERISVGQSMPGARRLKDWLPHFAFELLEVCYSVTSFPRLVAAYLRHRPDVIYERLAPFQIAGALLKWAGDAPLIVEVNAPMFEERLAYGGLSLRRVARWSEQLVLRRADYVLPVSHALAATIRRAGIADDRVITVPNGVDPARFEAAPATEEAKRALALSDRAVLGFAGFARDWHRLDRAIPLLARHGDRHRLHLLIVGDGPACEPLWQQARAHRVSDRLTITGAISHERIPHYLAAFDIALQPGVTPYASPLKIFEYMALGRAVVAPDTPNVREILVDRETALLFDPAADLDFERCILSLCQAPALRATLGNAARRAILERGFTWHHNARRIEALVERHGN